MDLEASEGSGFRSGDRAEEPGRGAELTLFGRTFPRTQAALSFLFGRQEGGRRPAVVTNQHGESQKVSPTVIGGDGGKATRITAKAARDGRGSGKGGKKKGH